MFKRQKGDVEGITGGETDQRRQQVAHGGAFIIAALR
ncbi:hypothetical protein CCACVL1_09760 [Corchorus capsularis]|uniref:Uncharacterized protein n=1 Tax=Corchorus capsularis TaxID=210143 RepID=A0A1R3IUB2_COCAP|nr:hypothetical protein CCACVL1_09760 [Corchorus capsularis]